MSRPAISDATRAKLSEAGRCRFARAAAGRLDTWPCGHLKTPENTQQIGKAGCRCRECRVALARASEQRRSQADPDRYRRRYLPDALESTIGKLVALEREAARLGVTFTHEEIAEMIDAARQGDRIAAMRLRERL